MSNMSRPYVGRCQKIWRAKVIN